MSSLKTNHFVMTVLLTVIICLLAVPALAEEGMYLRDAALVDDGLHPGVYKVAAHPGDNGAAMGISSIAKQNLENGPTTESPAIIMGGAVPYEVKTGPTEYTVIPGGTLYAPYRYFRYKIIEEANQGGGGGTHKKMSGFDGSYVIIRVDVSELVKDAPTGSYLHVRQEGNKALMAQLAYDETENARAGVTTFSDALGNKTGSYLLDNGAASLKDQDGNDLDTPYVDVILYCSGTLVAGADTGSTDPNAVTADVKLQFYVDQTEDYNPSLTYDVNSTDANHATNVMKKYFDESKAPAGSLTSYVVKGSDLELEITNDDGARAEAPEFWSLRKALSWGNYNASPIKMICEVPVLEGLLIDNSAGVPDRHVILDVNSFDIQIANHQQTGAAGLTIKDATMTLQDGFNTTGAELAVGNNASLCIQSGGKLIVSDTCQLEAEYDAASVTQTEGETAAQPVTYDCGVISIENGGEIVNNGVISIEGTEGKPLDPAAPAIRDVKEAEFHIREGGTLTNNGCLLSYGSFFNMGTIVNNGRYGDVIESNDPDKGHFTYHKGIQISWKDDVTQDNITMGHLHNGKEGDVIQPNASIVNHGDIVLVPGILDNYGNLDNAADGTIYTCAVDEAVIPITPTLDAPTIMEKRILLGDTQAGWVSNEKGGELHNAGTIAAADVEIVSNGRTGRLTVDTKKKLHDGLSLENYGTAENTGSISLYGVYNFGELTNSGTIEKKVVLSRLVGQEGRLTDKGAVKLTNVYNAKKTVEGNSHIWTFSTLPVLKVSPLKQSCKAFEKPVWKVRAELKLDTEGAPSVKAEEKETVVFDGNAGDGAGNNGGTQEGKSTADEQQFQIIVMQAGPDVIRSAMTARVLLNEDTEVIGQEVPNSGGNISYYFYVDGNETDSVTATVRVTEIDLIPPTAITDLVYNGKEQTLITSGSVRDGELQYKLGPDGKWKSKLPTAKTAGTYTVYYKLSSAETEAGSVTVTIAKKAAFVSADDLSSVKGEALKELSCSISGILENDSVGTVTLSTDADPAVAGVYTITPKLTKRNENYAIRVENGTYRVTEDPFPVTAKDMYGVYSDDAATYKGFNIELKAPEGSVIYYSTQTPLDASNYQTAGTEASLFAQPAGAGTHTVYYYVRSSDGKYEVSGSRFVFIDKASQSAPTGLTVKDETYRNSRDGLIMGLKGQTMEYRRADNDGGYQTVYYPNLNAYAGTYLIRMMGDANHYASEDTTVVVKAGPYITISFDSNGGSPVESLTGLKVGDVAERPADPVYEGFTLIGWFKNDTGTAYDFSEFVSEDLELTAHWQLKDKPASPTLTYTGQEQALVTAPSWPLPNGYTIHYALGQNSMTVPEDSLFTASIPAASDIRTYYVWYRVWQQTNKDSGKYVTDPACAVVAIAPSGLDALDGLVYNGTEQELINGGQVTGGTLQYALGQSDSVVPESGWSEEIPKAIHAGTYYVWFRVVADENHNDVDPTCLVAGIRKADISPSVSISGWTYGEAANNPAINDDGNPGNGEVVFGYSQEAEGRYSTDAPQTAGTWYVKAFVAETKDYLGAETAPFSFVIEKAPLELQTSGYTGPYDGKAHGVTVDAGSLDAVVYYAEVKLTADNYMKDGSVTPITRTKAGSTVVYYYVAAENHRFEQPAGSLEIEIYELLPGESVMPAALKNIYNGKEQPLLQAPAGLPEGYATVKYSLDGGKNWSASIPTRSHVGSYSIHVLYTGGDASHPEFVCGPIVSVIDKAKITITADSKTGTRGKKLSKLTYKVKGSYVSVDPLGIRLSTEAASTSKAGKYAINVSWNQNPNYTAVLKNGTYTLRDAVTANEKNEAKRRLDAGLRASFSGGAIQVNWGAVQDAESYEVYAAAKKGKKQKVGSVKGSQKSLSFKKLKGKKLKSGNKIRVSVAAFRNVNGKMTKIAESKQVTVTVKKK